MTYDTSRIRRMRERMLVRPAVCVERADILTRSFQATEGQSAVLRRAKAFYDLLSHMTIRIEPDELVVGRPTSKTRGGSISPELQCDWILNELDLLSTRDTDPFLPLSDKEKDTLRRVVPYWETRSVRAKWEELVPPESRPYDDLILGGGAFCGNNQFPGHASPDFSLILEVGAEGLMERIDRRVAQGGTEEQLAELEGMKLCLSALALLGRRYADHAQSMAERESAPARRRELEQIAAHCRQVPAGPARTFHEAVQSLWLTYMCVLLENWGPGNTFLRADQYLYPFYRRDVEAGTLDEQTAFELCASLLINCNCACVVYSDHRVKGFAGNNSGCSFTLGGVTPEGKCAVNELSHLFLDAEAVVCMGSDDLVVRISDNTPDDFLLHACRIARQVGGKLKFLGDKTTISNLEFDGVPAEFARNYAIAGCTSPVVGGQVYNIPGGILSLPGILELALNDGIHRLTGLQLGTKTGDCAAFETYEDLWNAFCTQVHHIIPHCHNIKNADKAAFSQLAPSPFQSSLCLPCVDSGIDLIDGGTAPHYFFSTAMAGAPTAGDSLAALKKYVFEEKRVSMARVKDALSTNFQNDPALHALLLSAPKFGNGDPYVDTLVNDVVTCVSDVIAATPGFHDAHSTAAAAAVTANVGLGMVLGATPDGRLAGQPISEGGISPAQGRNTSGITGTLRSVASLDHTKLRHGEVLNLRIDPKAVEGEDKLRKFADLIRTYIDQGGFLVQFNIVSTETLRDAQLHPERHRDLVVRVATYAAYFIELGAELQEDIIQRLEMTSL